MSNCRILSVKGDQVSCEITLDEQDGVRVVIPATFTADNRDGEYSIKTDYHHFTKIPPDVHLVFGQHQVFVDRAKIYKEAESEINSMLWDSKFRMPGEFEKAEAVEA